MRYTSSTCCAKKGVHLVHLVQILCPSFEQHAGDLRFEQHVPQGG